MPTSEARIQANRANASLSRGPKSEEGKRASRANAYKHGLTGAGIVVDDSEAGEVKRRGAAFVRDLKPTSDVGLALVLHAARMSVRLDRCADHDTALLAERLDQVRADFVPPEGVDDDAEAERLLTQATHRALFDPSKPATLARKYEAAAERGFFRALKELRLVEKAEKVAKVAKPVVVPIAQVIAQAVASVVAPPVTAPVAKVEAPSKPLGSFFPQEEFCDEFDAMCVDSERSAARRGIKPALPVDFATFGGPVNVPFTVGRSR